MVRITLRYEGALRCRAEHGPSQVQLVTDAPTDNQGRGESFSPTDLCATALGSCMLTLMGIVAERHRWPLVGATVEVEKHMVADPLRRIGKLAVRIQVPGEWDESARRALEKAALTCPVKQSLSSAIEIQVEFAWGATPVLLD